MLLAFTLVFAFAACNGDGGSDVCEHIDDDEDGLCDECEVCIEHLDDDGAGEYNGKNKKKKEPKKITLSTFIFSAISLVLVTVMITWSVCLGVYREKLVEIADVDKGFADTYSDIDKLNAVFKAYSYGGVNEEAIKEILPKAYVAASGDRYAEYFTSEEYAAFMESVKGNSVGVGINIIDATVELGGAEYRTLKVVNVTRESPAMKAGVKVGDLVFYVGIGNARESVDSLGYEETMARLLGDAGTKAEFTVLRSSEGGYKEVEFSIVRKQIKSESVRYHVCETDAEVGVVEILTFDYTTPVQFTAAVDDLRSKGIEKFVFDVRYNSGGRLDSIVAVLSYFLDEGQTIIRTVDNKGNEEITKVAPIQDLTGDAAACNVSATDIGKYKGLSAVVLCNELTASAAELFVANFRDYGMAKIVGTKTFGKGSMQQTMSLKYFGIDGVLKLTTHMYFPPLGEGYDGIGITPDVTVALDESLASRNIYDIADAEDNQLQAAIKELK